MNRCLAIFLLIIGTAWAQLSPPQFVEKAERRMWQANTDAAPCEQQLNAAKGDPQITLPLAEALSAIFSVALADVQRLEASPEASAYKGIAEKTLEMRRNYYRHLHLCCKKTLERRKQDAALKAQGMSDKEIAEATRQDQKNLDDNLGQLRKMHPAMLKLDEERGAERKRLGLE